MCFVNIVWQKHNNVGYVYIRELISGSSENGFYMTAYMYNRYVLYYIDENCDVHKIRYLINDNKNAVKMVLSETEITAAPIYYNGIENIKIEIG